MEQFLKKIGWTSIITSLGFAILGLIIACYPNTTFQIISNVLGSILIAYGTIKIIEYFKMKDINSLYGTELSFGVIAALLGLVIIICSDMIQAMIRILIGIWIIYSSIMRFGVAIKFKNFNSNNKVWIAGLIIALIMLLCGIYIITSPGAIMMYIGIIMVIYAVMDIIEECIFMKNIQDIM